MVTVKDAHCTGSACAKIEAKWPELVQFSHRVINRGSATSARGELKRGWAQDCR